MSEDGKDPTRRDFIVKLGKFGTKSAAVGAAVGLVSGGTAGGVAGFQAGIAAGKASRDGEVTLLKGRAETAENNLAACQTGFDLNALEDLFATLHEPIEMLKVICNDTCEAKCVQQLCTVSHHLRSDIVNISGAIDKYLSSYENTVSTIDQVLKIISNEEEPSQVRLVLRRYTTLVETLRGGGEAKELQTIDVTNDFALTGSLMWYAKEGIKQLLHDKKYDKAETLIGFQDAAFAIVAAHLKKAKDALKDAKEGAELFLKSVGVASGAEMIDIGLSNYPFDEWSKKGYVRFYEAIQRMRDISEQLKMYICSQQRFDVTNLENYDDTNAVIALPSTFAKRYFVLPEYALALKKVAGAVQNPDGTNDATGFYKMIDQLAEDDSDRFVYWLKKLNGNEDNAAARYNVLKRVGRLNIDTFLEAVVDNSAPLQIETPRDHYHAIAVKIADEAALAPDSKSAEEIIIQRILEYVPEWDIEECAAETKTGMFTTRKTDGTGFGIMFSDIYKMAGWDYRPDIGKPMIIENGKPAITGIEVLYGYNIPNVSRCAVAVVISENGVRQRIYSRWGSVGSKNKGISTYAWDKFVEKYGIHHLEAFTNQLGGSGATYVN